MLQLAATTDTLELTTSSASAVDVYIAYVDHTLSTDDVEGGRQAIAIAAATTSGILNAPASGVVRRVKILTVRNKGTEVNDVTVTFDQNGTNFDIHKSQLRPGESLQYIEGRGFFESPRLVFPLNASDSGLVCSGAIAFVIPKSEIFVPNETPCRIGTMFRWRGLWSKTAAGTAAGTFAVRFGTDATLAGSTSRVAFTLTTPTAAVDNGTFDIQAIVRGPISGSCIVSGLGAFRHHLSTTGLFNLDHNIFNANSAAFDITPRDMVVCLSFLPNTSSVWTVSQCTTEVLNL